MTEPRPKTETAESDLGASASAPQTATVKADSNSNQPAVSALEMLLSIEDRARESKTEKELQFLIVNETRKLIGARQVFLIQATGQDQFQVKTVSSLAVVDRHTPFIRWIEGIVAQISKDARLGEPVTFSLPGFADPQADETTSYPFRWLLWQPMKLGDGSVFAGLLMARERTWAEGEQLVAGRLSRAFSHAWRALTGAKNLRPGRHLRRLVLPGFLLAVLAAGFVPVPLSALAPVQVVPKQAYNITAPIDGVIKRIEKAPNARVEKGDTLFAFDDTTLKNKYALSDREVGIAEADYRRSMQGAFSQEEARHRLAISRAEYSLKFAKRNYAQELLDQATVNAPISGLLIYSSKDDWEGRPVKTGEKIMQIADPARVKLRIDLPVADSIVLEEGAHVRVFLDSDPLHPFDARVVRVSYHAEAISPDTLAYKLFAEFDGREQSLPLIGARGTAQVFGEPVPLAFYLFRRPISYARQQFGL